MNRAYRVIYSKARQAFMVVNEVANASHKKARSTKALVTAVACTLMAMGAQVANADTGENPSYDHTYNNESVNITKDSNTNNLINAIFNGGTVTIGSDVNMTNEGDKKSASTGNIVFNGTKLDNQGGTFYANWFTIQNSDAKIVGASTESSMGGYGKVTITGSTVDMGTNALIWVGYPGDNTGLYRNFDVINSTITMHGVADTKQQADSTPSYKPKHSSRAVLFGSFYKNNTDSDLSITDPNKLGNKLVLTNSIINVTGAAGINFLYGEVDRTSSINIASGGDLIISSYSGDGQGTSKMTGSTFTIKGTLNNKGKLANEVDNLIIDGGVFDNTSGSFVSNVVTVNGEVTNAMVTVQNGGKLITSSSYGSQASGWTFNPAGGLTLASGGQLVLTALNSNEAASLEQGGSSNVKDQFLVQFPLILDGGTFAMQDGSAVTKMKIGSQAATSSGATTTLTILSGDYSLDNLNFANGSGCTVAINGGSLTLKKLNMSATQGSTTINAGGTLTVTDEIKGTNSDKNLVLNGGTLATKSGLIMTSAATTTSAPEGQLWKFADSGNSFWTGNTTLTSGYVDLIDITGSYTLQDLKAAQKALSSDGKVQVTFSKGTIKVNGDLTSSDVDGVAVVGQEVKVSGSDASFSSGSTTVGSLNFSSGSGTATINTNSGSLTLSGESGNGNVFGGNMKSVTVSGSLTLGIAGAASQTNVNADNLSADKITVNGTVSGNTITITGSGSTITSGASLSATSIDGGSNGLAVSGTLSANTVSGTVNVQSGGGVYLTSGLNGASINGTLQSGKVTTLKLRMTRSLLSTNDTTTSSTYNSLISTNSRAASILANSTLGSQAYAGRDVFFVDNLVKVGTNGKVNLGTESTGLDMFGTNGSITVGKTGTLVVDASKLSSTAPIIEGSVDASTSGAQVALLNVTGLGTYYLADSINLGSDNTSLTTDNLFVKGTVDSTNGNAGKVTLAFNDSAVSNKALQGQMSRAMNDRRNGAVLLAVGQSNTYVDTQTQQLNALGEKAVSQYLATPVVAGTYNAALDAVSTLSNALYLHSAEAGKNAALWANVLASSNSADTLFGDSGYESDVFGGVLGLEGTMPCGAHFGLAISAGSSDANSVNAVNAFTSTGDFLGVSAYASHALVNNTVLVSADFSYLWLQNDIAGYVAGASVAEKVNSSVKTLGVRGDWLAYQGLVDVTPHVAIRYVGVDMDSYRSIESENANLFQIPVGVKLSKTFTSPSGVQLMPTFDFTATPKFGDTKINTALGDTRIDNSQFNTAVGLSGTFDAYTFNLSYQYGFGAGERADNVFNASVRYTF